MKGIDCVTRLTAETAAKAKAAGFDFVGRYLVPEGMGKHLTRDEARAISGAGLGILCVWETYESRAAEGAGAGGVDGAKAYQCARAVDMPEDGIIYFAVDFDAQPHHMAGIAEYLKAARAQTGPYSVGVYGSYRVVEEMSARLPGLCRGFWQCVAWSGGALSTHRTVYQRVWSGGAEAQSAAAVLGFGVDINDCGDLKAAGIWRYPEPEKASWVDKISGEDAYKLLQKAQDYAAGLDVPEWGRSELAFAKSVGITDGTRPMALCTRLEAAVMAGRGK